MELDEFHIGDNRPIFFGVKRLNLTLTVNHEPQRALETLPALLALVIRSRMKEPAGWQKLKDSGTVTMGVRESSGLSYTIGDGKFVGFHIDV